VIDGRARYMEGQEAEVMKEAKTKENKETAA
jgi:hypothetical protein